MNDGIGPNPEMDGDVIDRALPFAPDFNSLEPSDHGKCSLTSIIINIIIIIIIIRD